MREDRNRVQVDFLQNRQSRLCERRRGAQFVCVSSIGPFCASIGLVGEGCVNSREVSKRGQLMEGLKRQWLERRPLSDFRRYQNKNLSVLIERWYAPQVRTFPYLL